MKRIMGIDIAKFILIFLVVLGHILEFSINNEVINKIFIFIYSFHMPSFILLLGLTNKKFKKERIFYFLKLLLLFQILYGVIIFILIYNDPIVFEYFVPKEDNINYLSIFTPIWLLWFLLTSVWLLLSSKLFSAFKKTFIIAIILGVICFLVPNIDRAFSFQRTLYLLPFFVIGYYVDYNNFIKWLIKYRFIFYTISIFISVILILFNINHEYFLYASSYRYFNLTLLEAVIVRIAIYFISFIFVGLFFILSSKIKSSKFNINTIYIYLIHSFLILFLLGIGYYSFINSFNSIIIVIFGLIITCIIIYIIYKGGLIFGKFNKQKRS